MTIHAVAKLLDLEIRYLTLMLEINLVGYYYDVLYRLFAVIVVLVYPLIQIIEALDIRNIEHKNTTTGPPIVRRRQRPELFLTCRVPDLQFNDLVLEAHEL